MKTAPQRWGHMSLAAYVSTLALALLILARTAGVS
jgi:hypothetical protein